MATILQTTFRSACLRRPEMFIFWLKFCWNLSSKTPFATGFNQSRDTRPLPKPMMSIIYDTIWCHRKNELIISWLPMNEWHQEYWLSYHSDATMSAMASQITGVSIVYSNFCSGADQREHQSSVSLTFVRGIHRWPVNAPHKGPVTRKIFPFDDVIMWYFRVNILVLSSSL